MKAQKKNIISKAAKEYLEGKELLRAYLRGEITLQTLHERGIKLRQPI